MYNSAMIRITAGAINKVNDVVVGMPGAPFGPGLSKFAGQLGQGFYMDDNTILYDATTGVVYGGHFRYVRLSAASSAVVRGQIVFWDTLVNAVENLYQVTTLETGSATGATLKAGIVLNPNWTAGNYSIIQDFGLCGVHYRAALTGAAATGAGVYCAGAGAGADNGFADVQTQSTAITDIMLQRFIGTAAELPVANQVKLVYVNLMNLRG